MKTLFITISSLGKYFADKKVKELIEKRRAIVERNDLEYLGFGVYTDKNGKHYKFATNTTHLFEVNSSYLRKVSRKK